MPPSECEKISQTGLKLQSLRRSWYARTLQEVEHGYIDVGQHSGRYGRLTACSKQHSIVVARIALVIAHRHSSIRTSPLLLTRLCVHTRLLILVNQERGLMRHCADSCLRLWCRARSRASSKVRPSIDAQTCQSTDKVLCICRWPSSCPWTLPSASRWWFRQ